VPTRLAAFALAAALTLPGAAAAGAGRTRTFVAYRYVDPRTGLEAFRALVPKGWRAEGSITWSADPALPAQARFRFSDPDGLTGLDLFPAAAFFWTDNRTFLATNPPGTLRFGTKVAAPVDVSTALRRWILPTVRGGAAGLRVVREEPVPELARLARGEPAGGARTSGQAAKLRLEYAEGGRPVEEELFASVAEVVIPLPGSALSPPYWIEYWSIDHVFALRAPRGRLEAERRTFETMIRSIVVNPRWFAKVVNVREALVADAMRGIHRAGQLGAAISAAGSQLRDDQLADWERRQRVNDRVVEDFTDGIRGVDRFVDERAGKEVELPSGYGKAWANDLGEYIVTDDPNLNPNVGSNQHWVELHLR